MRILVFWILFTQSFLFGQDLISFNQERRAIDRYGMVALTSWSAINLGIGIYGNSQFDGQTKYFHQMNAMWSGFNLCLAIPGLIQSYNDKDDRSDKIKTLQLQTKTEKIFLFNAALDAAYITGGFLLKERAKWDVLNADRLNGFGNAVILQGGFLMVFDAIMCTWHSKHKKALLPQLELGMNSFGPRIRWNFN